MSDTPKAFSRGLDLLIDAMPPEGEKEAFNQWLVDVLPSLEAEKYVKARTDENFSPKGSQRRLRAPP